MRRIHPIRGSTARKAPNEHRSHLRNSRAHRRKHEHEHEPEPEHGRGRTQPSPHWCALRGTGPTTAAHYPAWPVSFNYSCRYSGRVRCHWPVDQWRGSCCNRVDRLTLLSAGECRTWPEPLAVGRSGGATCGPAIGHGRYRPIEPAGQHNPAARPKHRYSKEVRQVVPVRSGSQRQRRPCSAG